MVNNKRFVIQWVHEVEIFADSIDTARERWDQLNVGQLDSECNNREGAAITHKIVRVNHMKEKETNANRTDR